MKSRKIVAIGLACVPALSISACSSNATGPTESEAVSQVPDASTSQVVSEAIEIATFEVETEEGTEADEAEETEASSEAEEVEETEASSEAEEVEETEAVEVEETKAEEVTPATTKEPETEKAEPVHTHSYTSSVTKEATCDTNGTKTYVCSCGDSYTESIKATGHTYDGGKVVKEATCTEAGGKVFTCTKCGAVYTEAISAHGHNNVTTEATGHIEQVQVGTEQVLVRNEKRQYAKCTNCDSVMYTNDEMYGHSDPGSPYYHPGCEFAGHYIYTEYVPVYEEKPVYENRWVEDTPATTVCTICGQRQ